ncbi:ANTAR domain-containing protein [Kribbella deserti]|uniref:ANTAR domain-containing protein n=1 Tax=Kribbella deserti TaxID=1926257 RepID=A0ABV6QV10_9ACTN
MDELELRLSAQRVVALEEQARQHAEAEAAHAQREAETLQVAIDINRVIGQALGLLMERYELEPDRAFDVLRRYSQDSNRKLDVAHEIVTARHFRPTERPRHQTRPLVGHATTLAPITRSTWRLWPGGPRPWSTSR